MDEQNKERVRQHMEARKHADARHAHAVANFHELMRKREEDYNRRQEVPYKLAMFLHQLDDDFLLPLRHLLMMKWSMTTA